MQKLNEYRSLLNKLEVALEEVLPERIQSDWSKDLLLKSAQEMVLDLQAILLPARDLIKRGGKRWRPLVFLLTAQALGVSLSHEHYLLSLCIELPHNGSLIIDDIEDRSDTRRGQAAIHKIYGEDVAINTGNFLYFLPTYLLEKVDLSVPMKGNLIFSWLAVMRQLHIGQGLDIGWHNNPLYLPSIQEYSDMCRWKTGSLAGLAAQWGGLLGGLPAQEAEELGEIWQKIGIAFQILDDTNNLKAGNAGKKRGDDLLEGKKSYPLLIYALSHNPVPLLEDIKKLKEMKNSLEQGIMIDSIIEHLNEKNCLQLAYEDGKKLLEECKDELIMVLPAGKARDLLISLLESFSN